MKIAAVICEYNPFHNGHAYQLAETRRRCGADFVICLMSGDFVQRGTPAVLSKYDRARCALSSGADLVLELPVLWATSSADYFAEGAVSILNGLGCVDVLSFGAECEDLSLLTKLSGILSEEPPRFKEALNSALKAGNTFAAAQAAAFREVWSEGIKESGESVESVESVESGKSVESGESVESVESVESDEWESSVRSEESGERGNSVRPEESGERTGSGESFAELLSQPNNILALSYLKALRKTGSSISPLLIHREGGNYNDSALHEDFSSAAAIRKAMTGFSRLSVEEKTVLNRQLKENLPAESYAVLSAALSENSWLEMNDFSPVLYYALSSIDREENIRKIDCNFDFADKTELALMADGSAGPASKLALMADGSAGPASKLALMADGNVDSACKLALIADGNVDLASRTRHLLPSYLSAETFAQKLKTRQITQARVNRFLIHTMLSVSETLRAEAVSAGFSPYARILGIRKESESLLKILHENSSIPILTNPAKDSGLLQDLSKELFAMDTFAADLYMKTMSQKTGILYQAELSRPLLTI